MNKDEVKKMLSVCIDPMCGRDDCNKQCKYSDYVCCQDYLCRDALAVIEEQEREIEKQNSRVKCLKTRLANKMVLLANVEEQYEYKNKCFEEEKQELATALNQAKIDVLKELREKLDSEPNNWAYIVYIDEIIKELENENTKT